jgi:hypothetical protein
MKHASQPPPDRRPMVRNDGSHHTSSQDDDWELYDSPAYQLGCRNPAVLEKLGELDDVVFEAIAGRGAAVDRLRSLWPEVLRMVGDDLVAESREAYLRHAIEKWHECATADVLRNPKLAVTLMDVLAILLQEA